MKTALQVEIEKNKVTPIGQERNMFLMVKAIDEKNPNLVHAVVSTDKIDRYDEIVMPESFREALSSFIQNPVILPAHMHRLDNGDPPVIGNAVTSSIQIMTNSVEMDILFDDDELGQKYARKYQKKMMRAFSIGFKGLDGRSEMRDGKNIWIWTRIELLEISAVAVPANTGALARAKGYYQADESKAAVPESVKEFLKNNFDEIRDIIEQKFDDIACVIIAERKGTADPQLSEGDELPNAGGDELKNAEQHLNRIENAFGKVT